VTNVGGYTIHTFTSVGTTSFLPGGALPDLSGSVLAGTLTNGPVYSSANGGTIVFDGSNDFIVTPSITLNLSAGVSMEMVFRSTDIQSRAQGYMSFSPAPQYVNFYSAGTGALRWETWINAGSVGGAFFSPATLTNNTWYHAIGTYSNTGAAILYINGVQVASAAYAAVGYGSLTSTIRIGEYAGYISGSIPIAKIYNRPLSADEVARNFQAQRGRFGI
jgi:hypothetical protein